MKQRSTVLDDKRPLTETEPECVILLPSESLCDLKFDGKLVKFPFI